MSEEHIMMECNAFETGLQLKQCDKFISSHINLWGHHRIPEINICNVFFSPLSDLFVIEYTTKNNFDGFTLAGYLFRMLALPKDK